MPYYDSHGLAMPESAAPITTVYGTSAGGETLTAPPGPSGVSGEGGGDLLIGNTGDITFWVKDRLDQVQQPSGTTGVKTAIAYTSFTLPANVQNLTSYGNFNYAVGNNLANLIQVSGDQWVDGLGGDDVLVGPSQGRTTFQASAGNGSDVIYGWHTGDHLRLVNTTLATFAQIKSAMTQVGSDVVIQIDSSETLTLRNTTIAQFSATDFLLALDQSKVGSLTFSDDFNSLNLYNPSTNTGVWQTNFGGNLKDIWAYTLVSNGEIEAYITPDFVGAGDHALGYNPFSINNGVLSITSTPIAQGDQHAAYGAQYYSGMLNTMGSFAQKYGYFEIRAKMPPVAGAWPGFWMEPTPWKPNVEADIFEGLGATPNVDYVRAYGGEGSNETLYDDVYKMDGAGWHTYGMLWTASGVTFYLDGIAVLSGPTPSTWTDPMVLILNLAVGGWGGTPNQSGFPATLQIDYIHAYALADGSSTVSTLSPNVPAATIRQNGQPVPSTQGNAQITVPNFESGGSLSASSIVLSASPPNASSLPPGETFFIWESAGAVFGALSTGQYLNPATTLFAGTLSQIQATTWLTDHKVAIALLQNDSGVQNLWGLVFDPFAKYIVNKQQLGPASGNAHIAAELQGGFTATWNSGSTLQGRAYDGHAYDGQGWYGPTRPFAGDVLGINSTGELISAVTGNSTARQIYDVITPSNVVPASISLSPKLISQPEGNSGLTPFTYTVTRAWDLSGTSSVDWSVIGTSAFPASASDFQNGVYPSGTVTFAPGESTKTITINVVGDTTVENDETFNLTLNHVSGAVLGTAVVDGTIINDDTGGSPAPHGRPDFNADSNADLLWQNDNGQAAIWLMNGASQSGGGGAGPNPGTAWHVKSAADFNGDSKADILWQNSDGTPVIWFMNGATLVSGGVAGFNPGSTWHVIAAADFDGDGKADILWQNSDGTPAIWLMNGTSVTSGAALINPGSSWHVVGAGDFNGDGKADILWQNDSGQAAVWLMNGASLVNGSGVGPNPGTSWHVKTSGDFDGDGKSDILWQNNDGTTVIWFMNGTNLVSGAVAGGFNPGSTWHAVSAADYNADGKADIGWQNDNGTPAVWLMNGSSLLSGAAFTNPGNTWHMLATGS